MKAPQQMVLSQPQRLVHTHPFSGKPIEEWRARTPISWSIFNGPAAETLDLIENDSIDCAITSPPYFWLRDYKVTGQIGLEDNIEEYVAAIRSVMEKMRSKLKPDGTLFLNLGDTYYSGKGQPHGDDKKSSKRRFGLRAVDKSGGLGIGLQRKSIIGIPWRVATTMCADSWVCDHPSFGIAKTAYSNPLHEIDRVAAMSSCSCLQNLENTTSTKRTCPMITGPRTCGT
jgi:hypothetical protein